MGDGVSFSVNDCNFTATSVIRGDRVFTCLNRVQTSAIACFIKTRPFRPGVGRARILRIPTLRSVDHFSIQMMLTIMEAPFAVMIRI